MLFFPFDYFEGREKLILLDEYQIIKSVKLNILFNDDILGT